MPPVLFTHTYPVSSFLVNAQQRLSLVNLLNLLQDVAWLHATALGHGVEAMLRDGHAWVLTRQFLHMPDRWPLWGEEVTIRTWLRPVEGMVANRDFDIWLDDQLLGTACSGWMSIDLQTRRAVPFDLPPDVFRSEGLLERSPQKILPLADAEPLAVFRVRNSDLDGNGHVNNVRYAQWIVDALPLQDTRMHVVRDYEVNFLAEARPGDEVEIRRLGEHFQGWRASDQRVLFTARLAAEPVA